MSAALAAPAAADEALEHASAGTVLRWAARELAPGRAAVVSAFGPGSIVLFDLLRESGISLPVVFIDTLHHFPETLELVERVRERYDLDLRVHRPAESREAFEAWYGPRLWERDLELYQQVTKVEPFRAATAELDGWITGRRRDQAYTRRQLPVVERGDRVRVNPLAGWTRAEVWGYIVRNGLPYNPLHDLGYGSIGDEPLTTPVGAGEHERAGRWRGTGKLECGIHVGQL
ncbi:MAG TPA: phosphoadenylyl-sulfate reductase [Longimicrobium sp.]